MIQAPRCKVWCFFSIYANFIAYRSCFSQNSARSTLFPFAPKIHTKGTRHPGLSRQKSRPDRLRPASDDPVLRHGWDGISKSATKLQKICDSCKKNLRFYVRLCPKGNRRRGIFINYLSLSSSLSWSSD